MTKQTKAEKLTELLTALDFNIRSQGVYHSEILKCQEKLEQLREQNESIKTQITTLITKGTRTNGTSNS